MKHGFWYDLIVLDMVFLCLDHVIT